MTPLVYSIELSVAGPSPIGTVEYMALSLVIGPIFDIYLSSVRPISSSAYALYFYFIEPIASFITTLVYSFRLNFSLYASYSAC